MGDLPEGWRGTRGCSSNGWDVWLGFNKDERRGRQWAIFSRRATEAGFPYTFDKHAVFDHPRLAEFAMDEISRAFARSNFTPDLLGVDPLAQYLADPRFGSF